MSTTHGRGTMRLALSLALAAGTLAGGALVSTPTAFASTGSGHQDRLKSRLAKSGGAITSSTVAQTCVDASNVTAQCPTIASFTVGPNQIRSSTTGLVTFPVTVVVDDPAGIAVEMDVAMGRGLDQPAPSVVVGYGYAPSPASASGTQKTFALTVESPYRPLIPQGAAPAYGDFYVNPIIWGVDPAAGPTDDPNGQPLVGANRIGNIKARSVITNTTSVTTVPYGQSFTVRGRLTRFDGSAQVGQKVNVYYVPAGTTRKSFAGTATTTSTGALSLVVRCWGTGAWFVNYPGTAFSTGAYKNAWVRVS